jgi:protein SCO1/2
MMHLTKATLGMAAIVAFSLPAAGAAQGGGFTVDAAKAANGMKLWKKHGCAGCHAFGRVNAGPDLAGVHERRSMEWIQRWMKNTTEMLQTDSIAMDLLAKAKGVKMPQIKVSDADIDALIHFIAQETEKKRARS